MFSSSHSQSKRLVGSVSESPSRSQSLTLLNGIGMEEEEGAWWDGDDMTLEMVTDIGSGDVDEDVSTLLLSSISKLTPILTSDGEVPR